jgi:dTDP-4-dehydrorhamnose reductase
LTKAWITGAGGLIGGCLARSAPACAPHLVVRPLTRAQLDLLDFNAVRQRFRDDAPDLVIHCAALSKSPECQKHPDLAWKLNVDLTATLADLARQIPLLFFSTDLVFEGHTGNYDETSPTNPPGVYGQTKVAAEKIILANPRHTVIRTSLNGGISLAGDRGFNEQLRKAFAADETLRLFVDEYRCPIAASVTARAVWELLIQNRPGLYHLAGSEKLSRWQIGTLLAARWPQLHPKIEAASLKEYAGAPRSPDTSLNCAKAQALLSFPLPGFTEWLRDQPNETF